MDNVLSKDQEPNLSIFHSNIRSVNKNFDNYLEVFRKCDKLPDIMAISETKWSDKSVESELIGYKFESVNSPTQAGGVALYVSNSFDYHIREDLNLGVNNCEDLWIEIEFNSQENKRKRNIIVAVIYRHPGPHYKQFSDALNKNFSLFSKQKIKLL